MRFFPEVKLSLLVAGAFIVMQNPAQSERLPLVIAHRGASGYLPEHTLVAKAFAHAAGADYLEQDVVITRDDQPVVLHDIHLDAVTDVARQFPDRVRSDGRYYVIDFTLAEIKQLQVTERIDLKTGTAVYPRRFPPGQATFTVPSLAEEIELVRGLNLSTGRQVGIYPEIKRPAWHRQQGKDASRIVLALLREYGYHDREDHVYVQCFDLGETRRIRQELGCKLKLVQLIGDDTWDQRETDYSSSRARARLRGIAEYADAIGPAIHQVLRRNQQGAVEPTGLVPLAHACGLQVHPYTARRDALPDIAEDFQKLLSLLAGAGVDGVFTDFPDVAVSWRNARGK